MCVILMKEVENGRKFCQKIIGPIQVTDNVTLSPSPTTTQGLMGSGFGMKSMISTSLILDLFDNL